MADYKKIRIVDQSGTLLEEVNVKDEQARKVKYYYQQPVSVAQTAQIMRIPASGTDSSISTDTVVLDCQFANPKAMGTSMVWQSYPGYIIFIGTCYIATTANVVIGKKF